MGIPERKQAGTISIEFSSSLWNVLTTDQINLQGNAWVLLEENQWSSEWSKVVSMTSIEPIHSETRRTRSGATYASSNTYSSLEGIHISAISNLIKRPVIVVTDDIIHDLRGRALAPNNLGGRFYILPTKQLLVL